MANSLVRLAVDHQIGLLVVAELDGDRAQPLFNGLVPWNGIEDHQIVLFVSLLVQFNQNALIASQVGKNLVFYLIDGGFELFPRYPGMISRIEAPIREFDLALWFDS